MAALSQQTNRKPFPHDIDEFNSDTRISFSRLDECWILEEEDGSQWEFRESVAKWLPMLDEELRRQQAAAYAVAGVDETEPAQPAKKRKKADGQDDASLKKLRKGATDQPPPRKNTSVYVTNLPLDATHAEIVEAFSRYGMLAESLDTGEKRVKLYSDKSGNFKGEALVTYFREESVPLAIQMLDDSDLRLGKPNPAGTIKVSKADFSHKAQEQDGQNTKPISEREKQTRRNKFMKMKNKLTDWSDDDMPDVEGESRRNKVVVLKHMFTLEELKEDITLLLDIPEDIREECEKFGKVTNVIIYDKEPEGIVTVRFADGEAADDCVRALNGRNFAGQVVEAYVSHGKERFKKTNNKGPQTEEEELEEQERLDKFGAWLESGSR